MPFVTLRESPLAEGSDPVRIFYRQYGRGFPLVFLHGAGGLTAEQRKLYGRTFGAFTNSLNSMQASGLDSVSAARQVIELAEQVPAPSRAPVGDDAREMLRAVREKSDAEQDALRLRLAGLD